MWLTVTYSKGYYFPQHLFTVTYGKGYYFPQGYDTVTYGKGEAHHACSAATYCKGMCCFAVAAFTSSATTYSNDGGSQQHASWRREPDSI